MKEPINLIRQNSCLPKTIRQVVSVSALTWFIKYIYWFSPCTPVSSTNKTDRHDITEILLKVALNTINQPPFLINVIIIRMKVLLSHALVTLADLAILFRPFGLHSPKVL
jgi:hypothetical protein